MSQDISASEERVRVPIMQRILDNPFLLLFLSHPAAPLLAYLHPGRFASVSAAFSFPFPEGMKK